MVKMFALAAITAVLAPAVHGQTLDSVLSQKGEPKKLDVFRHLQLQPALRDAASSDIQSLPPDKAYESVINRLRADQASVGALPDSSLDRILDPKSGLSATLKALRERARQPKPMIGKTPLDDVLTDEDVLHVEIARQQYYLTNGFTPTPIDTSQAVRSTDGSPIKFLQDDLTPSERSTPQIIISYHRKRLTSQECKPDPGSVRAMPCLRSGDPSCPGFDPTRFAGIVQVMFGSGDDSGLCTGTLVADDWVLTAAHCFLGPGLHSPTKSTQEALGVGSEGPQIDSYHSLSIAQFVHERDASVTFPAFPTSSFRSRHIVAVFPHPDYKPEKDELPLKGPLNDIALIKIEQDQDLLSALRKRDAVPAMLPSASQSSAVTILGYGKTDVSDVAASEVNLTWPEANVIPVDGRLLIDKPLLRTFCSCDSGGPALLGLQRGCPVPPESNPLTLVGVISYHTGKTPDSHGCQVSEVSAFTDIASKESRKFLCGVTHNAIRGCP